MDDQLVTQRDWSNLPNVVLFLVLKSLKNTQTDCRRLRAVCTSWRSSISPPAPPLEFPYKVMPPAPEFGDHFRLLTKRVVYLISLPEESSIASDVWLVRVEETLHPSNPPNIWKLKCPVWGVTAVNASPLPELKAKVNLLDYRISQVATSYRMLSSPLTIETIQTLHNIKTAMLFSSKSEGTDHENFWLLMLSFSLAFTQTLFLFSSETDKWVNFSHECDGIIAAITAHNGKFYATNYKGKVIVIDPISLEVKEIIKPHFEKQFCNICFLESCGSLYIVGKADYRFRNRFPPDIAIKADHINIPMFEIKVFCLSYSCSSNGDVSHYWEPVTSLGDRVFVVSDYVNFSVSAQELGWNNQGNCILFTHSEYEEPEDYVVKDADLDSQCKCCVLYNLEDGQIITTNCLPSKCSRTFWPVPSWLASKQY